MYACVMYVRMYVGMYVARINPNSVQVRVTREGTFKLDPGENQTMTFRVHDIGKGQGEFKGQKVYLSVTIICGYNI